MVLQLEGDSESSGGLLETQNPRLQPQSFWFIRSGARPETLHLLRVPR